MNRKFWVLNFVLLALAVAAGLQLRSRWVAYHERERATLTHRIQPLKPPPFSPDLPPGATTAANYLGVAQKDLFDASRNPDVPVVPPPAPPPPPPPPPMPALPVYHGAMNFGDGPLAIMSVNAGGRHEAVKPGEMIGPFKLIDITRADLTLEWNGEMVRKQLWELENHNSPQPVQTQAANGAAPASPPPPTVKEESKGPGVETRTGSRICQPGDTDAVGTVRDGYKKVNIATPFGTSSCLWDPVGK
ncbi:MAG TPA: hypothetical protein VHW24_01370 [Bryobacteraceae bacterium]|nr:hypothetical protein [Bryobacteraceae bacterium]